MCTGLIAARQNANDDKVRLIMISQNNPTKTKIDLRIDDLQNLIKLHEDTINKYKRELEELKPTVHY